MSNLIAAIVCSTGGVICACMGSTAFAILNFGLAIINLILWRS